MKKRLAFGARYKDIYLGSLRMYVVCTYSWWWKEEFKMEQLYELNDGTFWKRRNDQLLIDKSSIPSNNSISLTPAEQTNENSKNTEMVGENQNPDPITTFKMSSDINNAKPEMCVKNRDHLYRLIISQLFYDGHSTIASSLAAKVNVDPPCSPSDQLMNRQKESEQALNLNPIQEMLIGPGIDLEFETNVICAAPEPSLYETVYVTSHKGACRAGEFSPGGQLIATGSTKAHDIGSTDSQEGQGHPVIRTLYDHLDEVTCLEFHPNKPILTSGSRNCHVKLFDYSKTYVKKALKIIDDVEPTTCISFHPLGDFLVMGTNSPIIRLYDINTVQGFVCSVPSYQHTGPITSIKFEPGARYFVSSSRDGSIKLWNGVSNKCFNTFEKAHDGSQVCSVTFSRNRKYILSSGKDSLVKLWELSTGRCLIAYTGAGKTDEATTSLCAWNACNVSRQQLLSLDNLFCQMNLFY
ncbi:hypothetical protein QTP88_000244 [Uroleucon formosanum]